MKSFEWFAAERQELKSQRFHVCSEAPCLDYVQANDEYAVFLRTFGECSLYRRGTRYGISLHCPVPPEAHSGLSSVDWLQIGTYRNELLMEQVTDSPTRLIAEFASGLGHIRPVGQTFAEWFRAAGQSMRRSYSKREWREMALDPLPFSERELEIVSWRKLFKVQVVVAMLVDGKPSIEIEVRCVGARLPPLKHLTVVVSDHKGVVKHVFMNLAQMSAGIMRRSTDVSGVADLDAVTAQIGGDPLPEQRDIYWEFGIP